MEAARARWREGGRDAEDERVTTKFIKMGNSEGVCWRKH